jgi:S1-C subfamily serine protease
MFLAMILFFAVRIESIEANSTSWGSGVCVASQNDSLILTANHVIKDGHTIRIDGVAAKVVGRDPVWDIAALLVPTKYPVSYISVTRPKIGDILTACGFGSGDYREVSGSLVKWFSPGGDHPSDILACNKSVRSGDSGGPIFDKNGTLVAILFGSDKTGVHGTCCVQIRKFIMHLDIPPELKHQALRTPYVIYGK